MIKWIGGIGGMLQLHLGVWLPKILFWLTSTEGILAVGGLLVATAIITDLIAKKKTDTTLTQLPVWSTGKVLAIASSAAFLNMGYNIDKAMPLTSPGISIPVTQLQQILGANSTAPLSNTDGSAYTGGLPEDGTPIVIKGKNGEGDRVLLISNNGIQNGQAMDNVKVVNLGSGVTFNAPTDPSGAYLPWVINGKPNLDAVKSGTTQSDLLAACQQGILDPVSCSNALKIATAGGKNVTPH